MISKVSFCVPVYNVEQYIEDCARTLFEQTLEDIEIVFANDGTPDNSVAVVNQLLEHYPARKSQVRWVHHPRNLGTGQARKSAVEAATGEFVLMIDSDDYVELDMAELLYERASSTGADVVQFDYYRDMGDKITMVRTMTEGQAVSSDVLKDAMINRVSDPFLCVRMFRRQLFESGDIFWAHCVMGEDVLLCSELMLLAEKIDYLSVPLVHYRYNPMSVTKVVTPQARVKKVEQYKQNIDCLVDFLEQKGVSEKYQAGIVKNKMAVRYQILAITNKRRYRKIWHDTFPEMNKLMFWGNSQHPSSFRNKIWYLSVMMGLYPRCPRILLSKFLRPSEEWRFPISIKYPLGINYDQR